MTKRNHWLLPIISAGIGLHMYTNVLFGRSKRMLQPKKHDYHIYNWKFGAIAYRETGAGKPLLLIHDTFSGSSSIEFNQLIHQLSKEYHVYALDLLGYGFSDKANITYTAYLYVQLINDFVKHVIKEDYINIMTSGNSHRFALLAAKQNPELLHKLILLNPGDLVDSSLNPSKADRTLKYLLELPFIGTSLYAWIHTPTRYRHQFELDRHSHHQMQDMISEFYRFTYYDHPNIRYAYASMRSRYLNMSVQEPLSVLDHSIYIINGEKRRPNPTEIKKQYQAINPSIESSIVKHSADFPHIENPYATLDLVHLFLEDPAEPSYSI